ncbi:MAG: hypothetical protein M3P84_01600 [Chloroflexota bacterium]|nr:hypothetical protein [Chloroflexota bacterium]
MAVAESDPAQSTPEERSARPIELVATEWLLAERQQTAAPSASTEATARKLAAEYEQAVRDASQEDLRLAWEAARVAQAACEMGSQEWGYARSVAVLLGTEYEASR